MPPYIHDNLFALAVTLGAVAALVLLTALLLVQGRGYSVSDTEAHATEYAGGEAYEGHGGMTAFLWLLFIFITVWLVAYFVQHRGEFAILFYH